MLLAIENMPRQKIAVVSKELEPGARHGSISWTASGNFWLFGGIGFGSTESTGYLNDFWIYNPSTFTWTFITGSGSVNQTGFGYKGQSSIHYYPGAREGAVSWTTTNRWLFGGRNHNGLLNDVWRFSPSNNMWSWQSGSDLPNQPGVYGVKGTTSPSTVPGAREYSVTWVDGNNNFWLFGGNGYSSSNDSVGLLNDLWIYTNDWTWISGNSEINSVGMYGIKGSGASTYFPGARRGAASWKSSNGDFWLFGGEGYGEVNERGYLNDLWRYRRTTNEWTWVSGEKLLNRTGTYGIPGIENINGPGARSGCVAQIDSTGNVFLFGGMGFANESFGLLNDLWRYNPTTNTWTWLNGSALVNQNGLYIDEQLASGTRPYTPQSGTPGSRYNAVSWVSSLDIYFFGGSGFDSVNYSPNLLSDIWRYSASPQSWTWQGSRNANQTGVYSLFEPSAVQPFSAQPSAASPMGVNAPSENSAASAAALMIIVYIVLPIIGVSAILLAFLVPRRHKFMARCERRKWRKRRAQKAPAVVEPEPAPMPAIYRNAKLVKSLENFQMHTITCPDCKYEIASITTLDEQLTEMTCTSCNSIIPLV